MAEIVPNPTPGIPPAPPVPPKKTETGKVQPKKETVRISLPPKPTSAPTIKLPSLPAGGPPPASAAPAAPVAGTRAPAPPAPAYAPRPPSPTAAPASRMAAAPAAPAAPARTAPAPAPAVRRVSGLDIGLAIAAAVVGIGAVVSVVLLLQLK